VHQQYEPSGSHPRRNRRPGHRHLINAAKRTRHNVELLSILLQPSSSEELRG